MGNRFYTGGMARRGFIDEFISWDDPMGLRIVLPVIVMGCCIMKFIKDSNQPK